MTLIQAVQTAKSPEGLDQGVAVCAKPDADLSLWFPAEGDNVSPRIAQALCQTCPFLAPCRESVLERNEEHGVWGGTTPNERRKIRKARRAAAQLAVEPIAAQAAPVELPQPVLVERPESVEWPTVAATTEPNRVAA